jgi:hypothetical protein
MDPALTSGTALGIDDALVANYGILYYRSALKISPTMSRTKVMMLVMYNMMSDAPINLDEEGVIPNLS